MNKVKVGKRIAIVALAVTSAIMYTVLFTTSESFTKRSEEIYLPVPNRGVPREKWDVLLCTYMRSGSSFVGKVLGWRDDSFYWYEPLWNMHTWHFLREDGQKCEYLKPNCKKNGSLAADRALSFLSDIYNCNLTNHVDKIKKGLHTKFSFSGPSWNPFLNCSKNKRTTMKQCLIALETVCRKASHRVTKVLRLDVSLTSRLLENNPRLKVVLLLRDPRAIISSHLNTFWFPMKKTNTSTSKLRDDSKVLCSRMKRDIEAIESLRTEYGSRVRVIQYENFENPIEKAKIIYNNFGMDLKMTDSELLHNLTEPKQSNKSIHRKGFNPFSYRTDLEWDIVTSIQNYCDDVIQSLGFINFTDRRQLKNLGKSVIKSHLPYPLE